MPRSPLSLPARLAVAALAVAGACAPPPPPAAPAPAPRPTEPAPPPVPPARDTAPRRPSPAARDSARAAPPAPPARAPRPRSAVPTPRAGALRLAAAAPRAAGELRVCAGGDVTLGTNLDTAWVVTASRRAGEPVPALPPPERLLGPLRPLVADAEVVLLNVEAAIGEGPAPRKCRPRSTACYAFRQPIAAAGALRALNPGAEVVGNLANNHARDAGASGFAATRRHLERAGVHVTGADTLATPVAVGPDTIAVLGFATSPGGPDVRDLAAVRRHVRRAADRWGRVVVTMHMGAEGARAQRVRAGRETFYGEDRGDPIAFATAALESGASLVVGHGPHVLRAIEWRGDRLVAYSLGNLVTYGPFTNAEPLNRGAVLCATLARDGAARDAIVAPTVQRRAGILALDERARALQLLDSLSRRDFPRSGARVQGDGRVLPPAARTRAR